MARIDEIYTEALEEVTIYGEKHEDRTGVGTTSLFGYQMKIPISFQFPLLTTKKIYWKGVVHELLWFIQGDTNIKYLNDNGIHIWDEWADKDGNLGPVYGKQWRNFGGVDQLEVIVDLLRNNPGSRRIVMSSWNPPDIPKMKLPPCHPLCQFKVHQADKGKDEKSLLSCHMYMRSADLFLGVPFNIASYGLLTYILADLVGMLPLNLIISFGDLHIYNNHKDQVQEQLCRPIDLDGPYINFTTHHNFIDLYRYDDIQLLGYQPLDAIKAPIAV